MLQVIIFQLAAILVLVGIVATKHMPAQNKTGYGFGPKPLIRFAILLFAVGTVIGSFVIAEELRSTLEAVPSYLR